MSPLEVLAWVAVGAAVVLILCLVALIVNGVMQALRPKPRTDGKCSCPVDHDA